MAAVQLDLYNTPKTQDKVYAIQRQSYLKKHGIDEDASVELADLTKMGSDFRVLPNDLARSSLFTAQNRKKPRERCWRKVLFHLHEAGGLSICYTGEELRAEDDEPVFLQLMEFAKNTAMGKPFRFFLKDMADSLGKKRGGEAYKGIRDCITRMKATEIMIRSEKAFGRSKAMSLIKEYEVINDGAGQADAYEMSMHPELVLLFAGKKFSAHAWEIYRDLSPVERRLMDYIQSHKTPYPLNIQQFANMCGCTVKDISEWRKTVVNACKGITAKTGAVCSVEKTGKNAQISITR